MRSFACDPRVGRQKKPDLRVRVTREERPAVGADVLVLGRDELTVRVEVPGVSAGALERDVRPADDGPNFLGEPGRTRAGYAAVALVDRSCVHRCSQFCGVQAVETLLKQLQNHATIVENITNNSPQAECFVDLC